MPKKILIVTKDIGEFNVYEPVVRALATQGVCCEIIAEGKSLPNWRAARVEEFCSRHGNIMGCSVADGTNYTNEAVSTMIRSVRPDLVLTGLGAPINLGEKFGLAANKLGIKLGFVHDLWGVHKRSKAIPDFVCVTDEFDAKLVREYPGYRVSMPSAGNPKVSELEDRTPKIYITGSPAMDALGDTPVNDALAVMLSDANQSVLLLGQDECTTPMIECVINALDRFGNDYILIPRLHPKFKSQTELWNGWLRRLSEAKNGRVVFVGSSVSTRSIMQSVLTVVSCYSTGLIEAVGFECEAVSLVNDIGRAKMQEALGVTRFPLVTLGCACEASSAYELFALLDEPALFPDCAKARKKLGLDGHATERAVNAILEQLG